MNFYEALVMTVFAIAAIIGAVCNYRSQIALENINKKYASAKAENERLKAENNRLRFGRQLEALFVDFAKPKK